MQIKKLLKKLNTIVRKPFFWVALLILITSIVFIPALKMKFWWVDDGWNIMMAQKIINSIVHIDFGGLSVVFSESNGRFRVMYWFYQTFEYLIGGINPTLHFFVHYLVILLSAFLIFRIVLRLTKSNLSAFVSSVLYVLSRINTENLYRLGPQEPLLCLFLIASIYFLIERKALWSIIFLLLTALSKETGFIIWIPVFCFYVAKRVLLKKRELFLEKYCLWGLIFSIPFILKIFLGQSGYSNNYILNVNQIAGNFGSYILSIKAGFSPFFTIFSATYLIRLIISFRNLRYKKIRLGLIYQGMFMILFLLFVAVQSPWVFVLDRYLMPGTVGLVIFMGLEISGIKEMLTIQKVRWTSWLAIIFGAFLFIFITINMVNVYYFGEGFAHQTRFIQSLYKRLADEVPPNGVVLMNFIKGDSTVELVAETGMHLDLLYHRPDIHIGYLSFESLPKGDFIIVGTARIREQYSRQIVEKSIGRYYKDESLIREDKFPVLTTPIEFFKQVTKKVFQLVIYKKPLSGDGIFTFSVLRDYWYRYYVEK